MNLVSLINLMCFSIAWTVSASAMTLGALDRARGPDIQRWCGDVLVLGIYQVL